VSLDVLAYCVAGLRDCALPPGRTLAFPAPGPHARQARLPGVTVAMAKQALPNATAADELSVFFGTALGCLTETQAFLENLILKSEATPMPRAFSASVHNAIASQISIALKTHGESQTFVHAEVAFLQALFAAVRHWEREKGGSILVGGVDECTPHAGEARAALNWRETTAEGGAVLVCGAPSSETPALARFRRVSLARQRDPLAWIANELRDERVDALLMAYPAGSPESHATLTMPLRVIESRALTGDHQSSVAASAAIAVAALSGELDPAALSLPNVPRVLAIAAASRFGDAGLAVLERAS
jgi:hypothetical protein